jgi:hypothetical protein
MRGMRASKMLEGRWVNTWEAHMAGYTNHRIISEACKRSLGINRVHVEIIRKAVQPGSAP